MKQAENSTEIEKNVRYSIRIRAHLERQISNHVLKLKQLSGKSHSRKKWVLEAINEKLNSWNPNEIENIKADSRLDLEISKSMNDKVNSIVSQIRKLNVKIDKKDFFIESVIEKLEREESRVEELLFTMLKKASQKNISREKSTNIC